MSVYPLMRFYPGEYSCAHKRSLGKATSDNFNHGIEGLKLEQNLKAAFLLRRMPSPELKKPRHTVPPSPASRQLLFLWTKLCHYPKSLSLKKNQTTKSLPLPSQGFI